MGKYINPKPFQVLKTFIYSLLCFCAVSITSCKKDDSVLKDQIAQLAEKISAIEKQITDINSSIITLQQSGKLNAEEAASLKELNTNLSAVVASIKISAETSSNDIKDLKLSLQKSASLVQVDEVKNTIGQLSALINQNYTDLNNENKNDKLLLSNLQVLTDKLGKDLDSLKIVETSQEIVGKIEKGAFAKGSILYMYELDSTLTQTGRSFNSTIIDSYGSFDVKLKNMKGRLCRIVADGFYFNEITGLNSTSRISLTGITKIDSSEQINLNVLTHLERPRVEYLMKTGKTFAVAKAQAVTEVLNAFGIANPGIQRSEKINLIGSAKRNNILLAISTMLVGFRSDGDLTENLNDIAQDLKTDGVISNVSLGNDIESHLYYMDTVAVLHNVKAKYTGLIADSILNKINLQYINTFKQNTNYTKTSDLIAYPKESVTVWNEKNALAESALSGKNNYFGITANLSSPALKLRVELTVNKFGDPSTLYIPGIDLASTSGWKVQTSADYKTVTLTSTTHGLIKSYMSSGNFFDKVQINIKVYENGTATPTKVYTVISNP